MGLPTPPPSSRPSSRPSPRLRRLGSVTAGAALVVAVLAGCGSTDTTATASTDPAHDDADVAFASEMSEHHQQALQMVDLTSGRTMDPGFTALVREIDADQSPQIAQMDGWLDQWNEPVPATSSDGMPGMGTMGGMSGHDASSTGPMDPTTMPGMMSDAQMSRLANASDATFERQWLRLMIAHHQGALTMADTEIADGAYPAAVALARTIETGQSDQIDRMRAMLRDGA